MKKREKFTILGICLLISFLFLMVGTKSSFLYPFNEWMDANCFFTVGKGMLHGKVFYLDLFDQKGPLLFFYHTIAALISYRSFLGVFIVEVVSFTFFLYYFYKTCHLYLKKITCLFSLPIISFIILSLPAFSHGDSAEELCLPFLMYSIYSMVLFFKSGEKTPSYSMILKNGIMAGLVTTIKFSMLGFWFAFMMCFFFYMIYHKEVKKAFVSCLVYLSGMCIPIVPWIIYFLCNNALGAFIDSYILFNIKYYASPLSPLLKALMVIEKPMRFMAKNLGFGIPFIIGAIACCLDNRILKKKSHKIILCTTFIFLCISTFVGGVSFRYYYLILTPFAVFGFIMVGQWLEAAYHITFSKNTHAVMMISTTLLFAFTFYGTMNTHMVKPLVEKEDMVQYQFAKIINQKKNATLLNYKFLDGGFYTVTGIVPNTRYFQKQNISDEVYPKIIREQNKMIREQKVDFVVTRTKIDRYETDKSTKYLKKFYNEVDRKNVTYEEKRYRYILWEKK